MGITPMRDSIPKATDKDSFTCIPNWQLRAAIKDVERGKAAQAQVDVLLQQIEVLKERIAVKEADIDNQKKKNDDLVVMVDKQNGEIALYQKVIIDKNKQLAIYERRWRSGKLWRWVFSGIGAVAGYFFATLII